jgi:hypothetical protein
VHGGRNGIAGRTVSFFQPSYVERATEPISSEYFTGLPVADHHHHLKPDMRILPFEILDGAFQHDVLSGSNMAKE